MPIQLDWRVCRSPMTIHCIGFPKERTKRTKTYLADADIMRKGVCTNNQVNKTSFRVSTLR